MESWKREILNGNVGEHVRSEYRKLLSVGKSGEDAEKLLVDYFRMQYPNNELMMGRFWLALALCEWEAGRLSGIADEKSRQWAMYPWENISKTSLETLLVTLKSPMPPKKKVRLPSYISHCPWPVGSLLAYRIISSKHPHVTQSPFYGKYVLLRIIKIIKKPVTQLAPDDAWDERMLVGLYNWIGDSVPDPKIVDDLQFTPVSIQEPMISSSVYQGMSISQDIVNSEQFQQLLVRTVQPRIETCCDLDWKCIRGIKATDVFTYLGCDPSYERNIPSFFKCDIGNYSMCHSLPFDADLVNRFIQLTKDLTV